MSLADARRVIGASAPRAPQAHLIETRPRPASLRRRRKPAVRRRAGAVRRPATPRWRAASDGALDDLLRRVGLDGRAVHRRRAARAAADPRPVARDRAEVQSRLRLLLRRAGRVRRRAEEHVDRRRAARGRPAGRRRGARRATQPRLPRRRAAGQPAGAAGGDAAGARARRSARRQDVAFRSPPTARC